MIGLPIHPVIHQQVTSLLVSDFGATPEQAAKLATRLIKSLRAYDMDIVRGNWMDGTADGGGALTWDSLAQGADALVEERNGIRPWMPPELQ